MEKKNRAIFLFFIFLIVTSFLISSPSIANLPKKITLSLSKLPLKLVSLSFLPVEAMVNCNRSLREISALRKENQQLKISLMRLEDAALENERLSELLSFNKKSNLSLVSARVISSDASNLRRSLVIDKGKNHKIKAGNPVITPDGVVGMVVKVGSLASRIILINDPDFSMAARVERSSAIGIISGSLEGMCKLKYLDLDEDVQIGDYVVSSGKNSRFPAGISIGEVIEVSKEHSGLMIFAVVKLKVKLSSLEEVLVVTNY